jgi:hypothetical protein
VPAECRFEYGSVQMLLTVAACAGNISDRVRLASVTLLDGTCKCVDDDVCTAGTQTSCASVQDSLRVCSEASCQDEGRPCTSLVDGTACEATLVCSAGLAVCPTTECQ